MALYRHGSELLPERRDISGSVIKSYDRNGYSLRFRRGRKFGRIAKRRCSVWMFVLALLFFIYLSFGTKIPFHGSNQGLRLEARRHSKGGHRRRHFPCEVGFADSVDDITEPKDFMNFTQFSTSYIHKEEILSGNGIIEPRFGGHQTLEERENSFYARNQTIHCGFVKGQDGYPSTGFDLFEKDKEYMNMCRIVVSSGIFGSSDFLRIPTRRKIFYLA